jgi:hypothetical protein
MSADKYEQIRRRAYEIWEGEGHPEGAQLRHWQQACDELGGEDQDVTSQDLPGTVGWDEATLLQAAGESDDTDRSRAKAEQPKKRLKNPVSGIEMTTGEKPPKQKTKSTEGP